MKNRINVVKSVAFVFVGSFMMIGVVCYAIINMGDFNYAFGLAIFASFLSLVLCTITFYEVIRNTTWKVSTVRTSRLIEDKSPSYTMSARWHEQEELDEAVPCTTQAVQQRAAPCASQGMQKRAALCTSQGKQQNAAPCTSQGMQQREAPCTPQGIQEDPIPSISQTITEESVTAPFFDSIDVENKQIFFSSVDLLSHQINQPGTSQTYYESEPTAQLDCYTTSEFDPYTTYELHQETSSKTSKCNAKLKKKSSKSHKTEGSKRNKSQSKCHTNADSINVIRVDSTIPNVHTSHTSTDHLNSDSTAEHISESWEKDSQVNTLVDAQKPTMMCADSISNINSSTAAPTDGASSCLERKVPSGVLISQTKEDCNDKLPLVTHKNGHLDSMSGKDNKVFVFIARL